MRPIPSPVTTATTLVVGAGPTGWPDGAASGRVRRLADPALLLDLLGQVGHPDPLRAPRIHPGLDRGPDVVGVDVAVPQPVPADDDDRVPDAGPHLFEVRHGVVRGVEEVHDLVAQVAHIVRTLVGSFASRPVPPARRRSPARRSRSLSTPAGRMRSTSDTSVGSGSRCAPSMIDQQASRRSKKPVPPASTTPA